MPTLAELAGVETPSGIDGFSLIPSLTGTGNQTHHDYLYWELPPYNFAKRQYIPEGLMQAVRTQNWKGVRPDAKTPIEVYDLDSDISESRDLALERPDIATKLEALMADAHTEMRPQTEPDHPEGTRYN
jgi:arylsulfatase A-like enzyme